MSRAPPRLVRRLGSSAGWLALSSALFALCGCHAAQAPAGPAVAENAPPAEQPGAGEAHREVIAATSCWLGGLWSDALGERLEARSRGIEGRCNAVLRSVFGMANPLGYEQLRALEPRVIDDIAFHVAAVAARDPIDRAHAADLVKLLRAIADAQRENVLARDAADDVKHDEELGSSTSERMWDKREAASALRRTDAIDALLTLDVGDLSSEAHALGLLCALDRLEISRRLPKHLKVYAVGGPFERVFGVPPPAVPANPTAPIPTGTWPGYLMAVAAAAGHPVPAAASQPIDQETLAWGGVLEGFAQRLRTSAREVSRATPLPDVLERVAARLDQEDRTLLELFRSESHHP